MVWGCCTPHSLITQIQSSLSMSYEDLNVTWRLAGHLLRVSQQIVIARFGISDRISFVQVQEFMLKNDTLKNGTSCIGLYGSIPIPVCIILL